MTLARASRVFRHTLRRRRLLELPYLFGGPSQDLNEPIGGAARHVSVAAINYGIGTFGDEIECIGDLVDTLTPLVASIAVLYRLTAYIL